MTKTLNITPCQENERLVYTQEGLKNQQQKAYKSQRPKEHLPKSYILEPQNRQVPGLRREP